MTTITNTELLLRLGLALAFGGAIGYERELRDRPAGLRTHLIVALASATFALVSLHVVFFQHYDPSNPLVRMDVGRIASNVVVGIGFLGGGAILHSGGSVKGLTTAGSLWLVAAIGLASGGGMFLLAFLVTVLSLFSLVVLYYSIEVPRRRVVRLKVRIDLEGDFLTRAALIAYVEPAGAVVTGIDYSRNLANNRSRMLVDVRLPDDGFEEPLMRRLEGLTGLRRVRVERPE